MNKKISVEAFIAKNKATTSSNKKSKLTPFKTEIAELKKLGYTLDQIVEYLRLNDLIVGRSTVVYFIKNHIEIKQNSLQQDIQNKEELLGKAVIKSDQVQASKPMDGMNESKSGVFNWQTPIAKEDLF